jgi:hypothetical protein
VPQEVAPTPRRHGHRWILHGDCHASADLSELALPAKLLTFRTKHYRMISEAMMDSRTVGCG